LVRDPRGNDRLPLHDLEFATLVFHPEPPPQQDAADVFLDPLGLFPALGSPWLAR
jgi:hypothetical protein